MTCICKDCGNAFEITAGEEKFYKDRGLSLPKRCKSCREKNRNGGGDEPSQTKENRTYTGDADRKIRDIRASAIENDDPLDYEPKKKGFNPKKILPTVIFLAIALVVTGIFAATRGNRTADTTGTEDNVTAVSSVDEESATVSGSGNYTGTVVITSGENNDDASSAAASSVTQTTDKQTSQTTSAATTKAQTTQPSTTQKQTTTAAPSTTQKQTTTAAPSTTAKTVASTYKFRNSTLLNQHYEKHGKSMGFSSAEAYQAAASAVIENPNALHKTEAEDGDDVYFIESTGEFVVKSTDGYIRTYYYAKKSYFDKQ